MLQTNKKECSEYSSILPFNSVAQRNTQLTTEPMSLQGIPDLYPEKVILNPQIF